MREAVIAGVGIHKFGRFENETFEQIGQVAVRMALKDANNMSFKDVPIAFVGHMHGGTGAGQKVLAPIGLTGIPIVNVESACASSCTALQLAKQIVSSGIYDVALALGVEKMPRGFMVMTSYPEWQMLSGLGVNPIMFALRANKHMADYGTTSEHFAKVSVKNHKNGVLNPYAMYQKEFTLEEVLNSRMVCYPLRLLDFCAPDEGAAAAIVCSRDVASKYTDKPITIAAIATGVAQYGTQRCMAGTGDIGQTTKIHNPDVVTVLAKKVFEEAGIGTEDIDLVELQDTDSSSEIVNAEALGLCGQGEYTRYLDEGRWDPGGYLPINVSGGLLSKGEPTGASHLGQVVEVTWQLRGQAGPRQVPDAKVGLCQVDGAGGNAGITILKR